MLKEVAGKKKSWFIGCYNKSVILTYIGICVALFGIANSHIIRVALICLVISGLCDLFDGPIARLCKNRTDTDKKFGIQIDTLADVIISLILPSTIAYELLDNNFYFIIILYVLAGVIRLAWFNIHTEIDKHTKYFIGVPVTYITLVMPIAYIISSGSSIIICTVMLTMSILFILNIKVKKPTGIWYIIFSNTSIITIILLILN